MENHFRNLTHENLQRVIQVCDQLHEADPGESFILHCHTIMNQAFSNVHFSAELYQLDPFMLREQEIHTLDDDHWIPLFKEHIMDHPYAKRMFTQVAPELGMTHLEPTLNEFHSSALFNEFYVQVEAQNQLWIGIREDNELLNCVYSREKEYTAEQMAMMCLIQPHLETAWKNWRQTRSLQKELGLLRGSIFLSEEEETAAAQIRQTLDTLTPRQCDVVELVAAGKDNQQIADALNISVLTVKKHLQAIFQSMEIQHRTELAAQWHQAHSVKMY